MQDVVPPFMTPSETSKYLRAPIVSENASPEDALAAAADAAHAIYKKQQDDSRRRAEGMEESIYTLMETGTDREEQLRCAVAWSTWEGETITLMPNPDYSDHFYDPEFALAFARIENHFFVHAGWLHIGFNLLMLLFCGRQVEHVLGRTGTLILYVAGAYAACFAQWAITPESVNPMVGASGAISAIIATYALLYSQQQVRRIGPLSANFVRVLWLAAAWIAIQLMIGVATAGGLGDLGQIAIAAHIGGFLAGLALTRPLLRWRFRKRPQPIN
jgi:membrane associated rhomboid family serine protease